MVSFLFDLRELYQHYPHLRVSYFFLPREHLSLIHWCIEGLKGDYVWHGVEHPSLVQHQSSIVDRVFDIWESYNYCEEMANARFTNQEDYLRIFDYTENIVRYLCLTIAQLTGPSEAGIRVRIVDTSLLNYGQLTLQAVALGS